MSDPTNPTDLVAHKVAEFFAQYPQRRYGKGQVLVFAGDEPQSIFYVIEGLVHQYDVSYRGDKIIVNTFTPATHFPMTWAMRPHVNKFFFEAATEVVLHHAPPLAVKALLKSDAEVMMHFLGGYCNAVEILFGRMTQLMAGTAQSRLLYELLIECRRHGQGHQGGRLLFVNESELAARAGLSRETVSREISKLRDAKLLEVSRRGILLKNITALEEKLQV